MVFMGNNTVFIDYRNISVIAWPTLTPQTQLLNHLSSEAKLCHLKWS